MPVAKKNMKINKPKPVSKTAKSVKPVVKNSSKSSVKVPVVKVSVKAVKKTTSVKSVVSKSSPAQKSVSVSKPGKAVKPVAKKTIAKTSPVKTPAVKGVKAILVKSPVNENGTSETKALKKTVSAPSIKVASKPEILMQKTESGLKPMVKPVAAKPVSKASAPMVARPAYRPIQVIYKSLAPVQPVRQMAPVSNNEKAEFKKGDYVVYPAHGVGEIEAIEMHNIGGMDIKLYAIVFEKDRMRLKVPVFKAHASGLRRLSNTGRMQDALKTLQGRAQVRRAMWSRRAQEYETKINSGDPVSIAEVLRDLKRSNDDSEQSYSERQIYQSALERLAREVAAVEKITEIEATDRLEKIIRGGRKAKGDDKAIEQLEEKTAIAA